MTDSVGLLAYLYSMLMLSEHLNQKPLQQFVLPKIPLSCMICVISTNQNNTKLEDMQVIDYFVKTVINQKSFVRCCQQLTKD
ncbi:MAG: hypothetical protein KME46_26130 [Brasilonema angustatum HA4187-MV1]|nr:hypothetical protein [Brasilonema angustatum HA4187-MV1]